MFKSFHLRIAAGNIRNNKSIYVPFLLASTLVITLFYSLRSMIPMIAQANISGGRTMGGMIDLSSYICGLFAVIVLFYINSFIMKRRKKEFGLYCILGMEKRHIARVMIWEVVLTGLISLVLGIAGGAVFSQLVFLVLMKIVGLPVKLVFQIPLNAVVVTLLLFGLELIVMLVYDIINISRTKPVELLSSAKTGEREPKTKWLTAIIGALALGAGYFLALWVRNPSDAISVFFPAVLLVIIGTYCLFLSGSIAVLKLLRGNKSFYYKPKNFISVSGMIYRMKQNATGLANICILSTAVLVTLASTVSLFAGLEDILKVRYPGEVTVWGIYTDEDNYNAMEEAAYRHANTYGVTVKDLVRYVEFTYPAVRNGNNLNTSDLYGEFDGYAMSVITIEDYNRGMGTDIVLNEGEALLYLQDTQWDSNTVSLNGIEYRLKQQVEKPEFLQFTNAWGGACVVVPTMDDIQQISRLVNQKYNEGERLTQVTMYHDVEGEADSEYYSTMREDFSTTVERLGTVSSVYTDRNEWMQIYGSLLFVGIFFVILFLIAAVLIIYYKQITEGYDDHDRFVIMQNVGMSDKEVRATISKQVLMVFFLPLGMALLHVAVAFPVLCKLLTGFGMTNVPLFAFCTLCAGAIFALFYFIVYRMTSQVYYKIVQAS